MVGSKHVRLRVGVIGLGRLWETRHKPSLARLGDRFRVTAVYDPVYRRAELEAAQIGCAACEGLAALVERPDVDVIYLLARQWFGLHPISLACAAGKPVYCALPLADDLAELEKLASLVEQSGIGFMPEFARRCYPATLRLKELLATQLGPPRLVVGQTTALWIRPLCGARSDDPDRAGAAGDRPRQLSGSTGAATSFSRSPRVCMGFGARSFLRPGPCGAGRRFREFRRRFSQGRDGSDLVRPLSPSDRGATPAASCPHPASRSLPSEERPGWRCPKRSSGRARREPRKNDSRWSRPSATCSTTSFIAWSAATTRSHRPFARPSISPGWSSEHAQEPARTSGSSASRPREG